MHQRPCRGLTRPVTFLLCLASAAGHAAAGTAPAPAPLLLAANYTSSATVERLRTIPADAEKGIMMPPIGRQVQINETMFMLAPGVTIRDMNNRMVLPSTLRRPKKIRYTLDMYGQVKRIWISPTGGLDRPRFQPPTPHD
jgi:hypothetical protein